MGAQRWFVLGFDCDDIVGAWQDWRLARQCVTTLAAAHRSPTSGILEGVGCGKHLTYWYVRGDVAAVLDDGGVPWRRFLVGEVETPPAAATRQLRCD
jgi:hypothetical protein